MGTVGIVALDTRFLGSIAALEVESCGPIAHGEQSGEYSSVAALTTDRSNLSLTRKRPIHPCRFATTFRNENSLVSQLDSA
jgi:hypothetical protein